MIGGDFRPWWDAIITACGNRSALVINPSVYAELAAGFDDPEDVAALPPELLEREVSQRAQGSGQQPL